MNHPTLPADMTSAATSIADQIAGRDDGTDPFAQAVRATRMPMIITDPRLPDNPVVFTNDAFCRLTGYARAEILGRNCRFLQGPDTDPDAVQAIRQAVQAVRSIEIDVRNHRRNGEPFWNRLLLAPVYDATGGLSYFFASQVDVTLERERLSGLESHNAALMAEVAGRLHAQQDSEARLRFATDSGRLGVWEMDLASGSFTASDMCKANLGCDPAAELSFDGLKALIHPADRAALSDAIDHAIRTGTELHVDCRKGQPGGSVGWVALRAQTMQGLDGQTLRLAGILSDVTETKQATIRKDLLLRLDDATRMLPEAGTVVQAAAGLLRDHLGADRVGFGRVQPDGQSILMEGDAAIPARSIQMATFGAAIVAQQRRGETVVRPDTGLMEGGAASHWAALATGAFVSVPLVRGGTLRACLYVSNRRPTNWNPADIQLMEEFAARIWDAVERARAEAELRDANARLESRIAEALAERLAVEETLRQSQKMEAVGQLTGGIAHDFNNLLTGITGSIEVISRRIAAGRTDGLERFTEAAITSAQRAAALTQRLLAFARRQPLDPRLVDAGRLMAGMEELLRRTLGPGVELVMVLDDRLWPTLCDPNQLENALLNLAINARDAMPDGGRLVAETGNARLDAAYGAAVAGEVAPGDYVCIAISDTGTGMTPEVLAKAFDPFFTTKPIGQGTGLGLSMLYGFVKQSGGHVRVYSEPDRGTTFRIYLPRHQGEAAEDPDPADFPSSTRAPNGETVLVVEDEAPVRLLVSETLGELGYRTVEAVDGPAALALLEDGATAIHLLVTDVGLPGMNGRQLAEAARLLRPGLPILFMTGYAHNAALAQGEALAEGMHMIAKPFTLDALAARVRGMVEGG